MEDSSQNPYIPQESEQIRQKVYERQSPLGRVVKWSLIATVILALLVGVGLFFVVPRTTAVDQPARVKMADILQPPDQTLKRVNVTSDLGFNLNYDNRVYSSYAEVGDNSAGTDNSAAIMNGQTYENNELRTKRAYNYIRIRPIESVDSARALSPQPPELELFATVPNSELVKAAAVPENKGMSKLSLFVKMDGDKRAARKVADDNTVVTIEATKPVSTKIGDADYQKVRYTTTNENYRVTNVKYDDCYYTIQYDQPYSICVSDVRPTNVSAASLVEQVFDSISFTQPENVNPNDGKSTKNDKTSFVSPAIRLAQATATSDETDTADESPLLTITPPYYSDAASLSAIAKNQPSVVRIGMLYCTDIALKLQSGDTVTTLSDACVGNLATGVFVSKDGYIATTGHAIRSQKKAAINGYINFASNQDQMLDRLQRVLDYLLKAKLLLQSDADYLKTGASNGNQEALAKVQNIASNIPDDYITAVKEDYTYAIQPTDKPIVINRTDSNKPSFAYSDSVIAAKYVAADYDAAKSVQEVFDSATPTVDVGLLKVNSGEFPDVTVATHEDTKANSLLNTIGYPAYTDSSLTIDKIRNTPVATVSKVEQAYQKEGTRLVQTNAPVLPGNDGAPVFDSTGQLVGFAVYGLSYCPDKLCFANGTVRSSSELLKLLDKENIKLSTGSKSATDWRDGVSRFMDANYATSANAFGLAANEYTYNRWAQPLQQLAVKSQGSEKDTSFMNQLQLTMMVILIVSVVATIVLLIIFIIHRRRISELRVGHYGESDAGSVSPVPPAAPAQVATQLPYVEQNSPGTPNAMGTQPMVTMQQPAANNQYQSQQLPPQPQESPLNNAGGGPVGQPGEQASQQSGDPFYK